MGRDKAALPFGAESMLQRIVRLVGEVVFWDRIVVVAAADQAAPPLPPALIVARDERKDRGPLQGLAAGFSALEGKADAAFVTACDAPFLNPRFVERLFQVLGEFEAAVPRVGDQRHPLAAVYHITTLPKVQEQLARDQLRLRDWLDLLAVREIDVAELRDIDPDLRSLQNLNRLEDYRAALSILSLDGATSAD